MRCPAHHTLTQRVEVPLTHDIDIASHTVPVPNSRGSAPQGCVPRSLVSQPQRVSGLRACDKCTHSNCDKTTLHRSALAATPPRPLIYPTTSSGTCRPALPTCTTARWDDDGEHRLTDSLRPGALPPVQHHDVAAGACHPACESGSTSMHAFCFPTHAAQIELDVKNNRLVQLPSDWRFSTKRCFIFVSHYLGQPTHQVDASQPDQQQVWPPYAQQGVA